MIVVDTNVLAYLFIAGDHTEGARAALRRDPAWAAPVLWRSELRSVLAGYLRRGEMELRVAADVMAEAEGILDGREYIVDSASVFALVAESRCSAYDCEFAALARQLGAPLVTSDRQILADFPEIAVSLKQFGRA
ncbi:MAG: type II toxin-antitoxin system VapC family toxin [Gemmatimonadales bacterium]|nr:type II toxin-antitoxin system VapC family toxin [Gemmatimonadales bacterium]